MNFEKPVIVTAIVSTLFPVIAVFLRGRSRRIVILATLLAAITLSFHLAVLLHLVQIGQQSTSSLWLYALVASAVPLLLAGHVLSVTFARDHPDESFRQSRRTFFFLSFVGALFLSALRRHSFVTGYDWIDGRGTIYLGSLGKAYLTYLLIGVVNVGYNLEKAYRISPSDTRYRLRLPILGFFGLLGYFTFVLATGLLYSGIGMGKLVALGLPITFASLVIAYGYLRGAITDVAAPVSRSIVYSSFTALAASLFVLAIAAAAQVATLTHWPPDQILIVASGFLVVLVAGLLLFSNHFQRRVRRFIDRNFYVNRYDYRAQWSNITESLENVTDRESILNRVMPFLKDVFAADEITIALRDAAGPEIRSVRGKGTGNPKGAFEQGSPLFLNLSQERKTLLLDRTPHDFTYIPIYAENSNWLEATASQIVAPLLDGESLMGTIGLERRDKEDAFTFEDVALLDSISVHVAAALRSMRLARELAETREVELMSQWSSMLLHDLKNYLAPLRMVATNLIQYKESPETVTICARDIDHVADRMDKLVLTLSELRKNPGLGMEAVCPNQIVRETLSEMQILRKSSIEVKLELEAGLAVLGDRDMLRRVLENLITNAIDAMDGKGTLQIRTEDHRMNGGGQVCIGVADTGCGIPESFLEERLFRPFATTKKKGLGLGLYQCRSIIRAHGGELTARSELGQGSMFQITLQGVKVEA